MVVEGADRFGLAQLHQLRGRVGRGGAASFCALVSDAAPSTAFWADLVAGRRVAETTEQARLVAVARTLDGFELAEADFELRREGDVLGLAQSGLPRLRVASLQRADHRLLATDARRHAEALLDEAGTLSAPELGPAPPRAGGGLARGHRRRRPGVRGVNRRRRATARPDADAGATARAPGAGMADAGRVIAGSARGRPAGRAGGGDPAARRPGQADPLRDPRAGPARQPRSSTSAPGAARPGSRRSRGARPWPSSSSGTTAAAGSIAANLAATGARRTEGGRGPGRRGPLARRPGDRAAPARRARSTSSSSTRRTPSRALLDRLLELLGPESDGRVLAARSARVVAKHFWRDRPPAASAC